MSQYKRAAVIGFGWQAFGLFGQQAIQLIANLIFARVLLREENGLVIASMAILDYATLLRVAGLTQAFVSYEGDDTEARHTVFWASFVSGLVFFCVLFFGAPLIGNLLGSPGIIPLVRALAIIQIIDSLRIVPFALVWRHLRFRERAIAEGVPFLIGLVAAIIAVIVLPQQSKIWALVWMYVVRSIFQAILFNVYEPYRPKANFDWIFFRLISRRSASFLGVNLPSSILEPLPTLFIVGKAGEAAGGSYGLASKVTSPAEKVGHAANQTLLPIFAKLKDQPDRLREAVLRSFKGLGFISTAVLAFVIVASPELIPLVLGEKWRSSVPVAQWLALAAMLRLYSYAAATVMLAVNRSIYTVLTWGMTFALAIVLFALWPLGDDGAATGAKLVAAYTAFSFVASLIALCACLPVSPVAVTLSVLPTTIASGFGLAVAWIGSAQFAIGDIATLGLKLFLFAATFLPVAGLLTRGSPFCLLGREGWRELLRQS